MKTQILQLRELGLSYTKIAEQLKCSKGTVSYYLGVGQKEKTRLRTFKNRKSHPYMKKIENFSQSVIHTKSGEVKSSVKLILKAKLERFSKMARSTKYQKPEFTVQDVIDKFGDKPICYLTGQQLDLDKPETFQFDHKIPRSRGGNNSIDNLGLCTSQANRAKSDMTYEEFIALCKKVINHNNK